MDYTNSEVRELVAEHIHSERDRELLIRHLCDGIGYERLAEEHCMSRSQVARIIPDKKRLILAQLETKERR